MATFALIHGAGDVGWYWHLVQQELRSLGHESVAPDLPCDDDAAGLPEYADTVTEAIGDRRDVVVVAQSFGGFTAPLVADRLTADALILLTAMIPAPGEAPADWTANTGFDRVMRQQGQGDVFYHDVPPDLAAIARSKTRAQSDTPGRDPWPLSSWPDVPTRFILCTQDRFFPPEFMGQVVADRLGIVPDEIASGHCAALSQPVELAAMLALYAAG
ncbi:MAG TPA: alpha/beta hydrolase [Streptosporangiaceae bacterium]|nr:alpha/beta hydrolase [Streptosporangiaceae bacterium]